MKFIHFGLRMEIERQYLDWCEREGIVNKPNSLVVFMMEKGWLNEEKIIKDLKELKDKPQICDFCKYYNSNIPCGTTPSACKKADKFANEFVNGLKKLKPNDESQM